MGYLWPKEQTSHYRERKEWQIPCDRKNHCFVYIYNIYIGIVYVDTAASSVWSL